MANYSLNLHPIYGYLIIIALSLILINISTYNETIKPFHKEKKINSYLFVIRLVHYIILILTSFYLFIFNASLDVFYLVYCSFLYLHWPFLNYECILSNLEYFYYDENYIPGTAEIKTIYLRQIFRKYTDNLILLLGIISVFSMSIILYRQEWLPILIKIISITIFILYMLYVYYRKRNLLKKKM